MKLGLTVKEEQRLRVFEIRMLKKIFGPKREEVTRDLRQLHNERLHDLYCSQNIIWVMKDYEMERACGMQAGEEKCIVGFAKKPERKIPLGRTKHRLSDKNNIKMALKEMGWHGLDPSGSG